MVSTFDNFTSQLLASGAVDNLPVVTQEIGDTWIYGDPSDAHKQARMRGLHRAWEQWEARGGGGGGGGGEDRAARDATVANASRFMLKNIEHVS